MSTVKLVGVGPGHPGLATMQAVEAIKDADVIRNYDGCGAGLLHLAQSNADVAPLETIDEVIKLARSGKKITVLFPGNPYAFSNGSAVADRESVWIAWKQHSDLLAAASELDHLIDRFEGRDVGIRLRKVKQTGAAAIVVANDVGVLDRFDCLHGRKTWMAWSYADELDRAHSTMSIPTRDMGDRLELSADHVLR